MKLDPNWVVNPNVRGGGQTTALMLRAIELMGGNSHVVFLAANGKQASWCWDHFDAMVFVNVLPVVRTGQQEFAHLVMGTRIWFESPGHNPMPYLVKRPAPSILVDHYAYEMGKGPFLDEWLHWAEERIRTESRPY